MLARAGSAPHLVDVALVRNREASAVRVTLVMAMHVRRAEAANTRDRVPAVVEHAIRVWVRLAVAPCGGLRAGPRERRERAVGRNLDREGAACWSAADVSGVKQEVPSATHICRNSPAGGGKFRHWPCMNQPLKSVYTSGETLSAELGWSVVCRPCTGISRCHLHIGGHTYVFAVHSLGPRHEMRGNMVGGSK